MHERFEIRPEDHRSVDIAPRSVRDGDGIDVFFDVADGVWIVRLGPCAGDTDEMEKRLGSILLAGQPCVSLDNVAGTVQSAMLWQVLERQRVQVRQLGTMKVPEAEARTTWFATGINLTVADDLTRRVLIGRLDSELERPELRAFRGDPVATVMRERGRYLAACLTVVRVYIVAGKPGRLPRLGSYGGLVRSGALGRWYGSTVPTRATALRRRARTTRPSSNAPPFSQHGLRMIAATPSAS